MPRAASQNPLAVVARQKVREDAACPTCGALVGEHCVSDSGAPREANHAARWEAAGVDLDKVPWSHQRRSTAASRKRRRSTPGGW